MYLGSVSAIVLATPPIPALCSSSELPQTGPPDGLALLTPAYSYSEEPHPSQKVVVHVIHLVILYSQ